MNMRYNFVHIALVLGVCVIALNSCGSGAGKAGSVLRIRIQEEPDCLNPIVSQSGLATQIEYQLMAEMFEYNPSKLELEAVLLKDLGQSKTINDSVIEYQYQFLDGATWDDQNPISSSDLEFTVKAALNPYIKNGAWRSSLKNVLSVREENKSCVVRVKKDYLLSQEISGNFNLYPKSIYDPNGLLDQFTIQDLRTKDSLSFSAEEHSKLKLFAEQFQGNEFCRKKISGAGPYRLKQWIPNSIIQLERKENHWSQSYVQTNPQLSALPKEIDYIVIPDINTALVELEKGSIDLVTNVTPKTFSSWKEDSKKNEKFSFYTPSLLQYSYIEVNHRNPILQDSLVRKALALLLPIDQFIQSQMFGFAQRIIGPVHLSKEYYHKNLEPISFNPNQAKILLEKAGWKDNNSDGLLDKAIGGKRTDLKLTLSTASQDLGKALGLLFQQEANKIGVQIDVQQKEWSQALKEINSHEFDLCLVTSRQNPGDWDPFQNWHSSNIQKGGSNKSGYHSSIIDSLISKIRTANTQQERKEAYLQFQEIIYRDQAQLFLYSPLERIICSKRIQLQLSNRKPGYLENRSAVLE